MLHFLDRLYFAMLVSVISIDTSDVVVYFLPLPYIDTVIVISVSRVFMNLKF